MSATATELKRRQNAHLVARLLEELEAGRFDSDVTRRLLALPGSHMQLLRAIAFAEAGYLASAREQIAACRRQLAGRPALELVAGMVLHVTHDYHESQELLRRAAAHPKAARVAYRQLCTFASRLGWEVDVRETIEQAIVAEPDALWWHNQAAQVHLRGRNTAQALIHVRGALAAAQRAPSEELGPDLSLFQLRMQEASLLAELGDYPAAQAVVERALTLDSCTAPRLRTAADVLMSIGAVDEARVRLLQAHRLQPQAALLAEVGRLALWVDDHDTVLARADEALALDPACAGALRLRGAVAVRRKQYTEAIEPLMEASAADPREYEAHVWRAEAALRLSDYTTVHEQLHQASMKAQGLLFVSWMLRFIAVAQQNNLPDEIVGPHRTEEFIKAAIELCPGCEAVFETRRERELVPVVERALVRLAGNRTVMATSYDPETGRLQRLKTRSGARYSSRHALQLIRVMSPEKTLEHLDRVVAAFPGSSLPVCHRGELLLWMGDLPRARKDLEQAISILPATRWAHIGLTGIDILEGNSERALETSARGVRTMNNTEGPSVYIYRGDALRRIGRHNAALRDLVRSVNIHPSRVSAWFNLGLLFAERGENELFEKVYARLCIQAPGLLSDAARECGEMLWGDPGFSPTVAARARVLEQALAMMKGNRSSTAMTYFTAEGRMRMVEHRDAGTPGNAGPHLVDAQVLHVARGWIFKSLGLNHRSEMPGPGTLDPDVREILAWRPTAGIQPVPPLRELTPQQVLEFENRGFVTLKGCFSREMAKEWVDDACRRLREEPARWIPEEQQQADGPRFDSEDPSTWMWPRLSLPGPRTVSIDEFAPRAWAAICDLLGGSDRIATSQLTDYFVVNFLQDGDGSGLFDERPDLDGAGWHLDDPKKATTLENWHHGLIVMCLFSDVRRRGGGTFFACDSPRKVARMLSAHPEGLDFVDSRESVVKLMADCRDFYEVTGEVGDVILIHPLMLHAGSANRSPAIRWLANPLIFTHEPMNFWRTDPDSESIVERVVARAIRG